MLPWMASVIQLFLVSSFRQRFVPAVAGSFRASDVVYSVQDLLGYVLSLVSHGGGGPSLKDVGGPDGFMAVRYCCPIRSWS